MRHKRSGNKQVINDTSTMLIKIPVVADVGEVVTVLTVLDVGEVTVVAVVVLSLMHTYAHRVQYFRQIIALLKIYNHLFITY